jgi:PAS domain S-box-containing protein
MADPSESVLVADTAGRLLYANKAACVLLGYSLAELTALSVRDTCPVDDRLAFEKRMQHILTHDESHFRRPLLCRDGTIIAVDVSWKKLDDGRLRAMIKPVATGHRTSTAPGRELRYERGNFGP